MNAAQKTMKQVSFMLVTKEELGMGATRKSIMFDVHAFVKRALKNGARRKSRR